MRKPSFRIPLLSLFTLISIWLQAQESTGEESHSSFFGVRTSVIIPGQSFNDPNSELAPRITGGFGAGLEGAYLFHPNIGIYGNYQFMSLTKAEGQATIGEWWVFESKEQWNTHALGISPYISYPLVNVAFEARFGPAFGFTSGYQHRALENNTFDQERIMDASFNEWWWQGGITARIDKYTDWNVAFSYEYSFVDANTQVTDSYANGSKVITQYPQRFGLSQIIISVIYSIPHYRK